MKYFSFLIAFVFFTSGFSGLATFAEASIPTTYTNDNFFNSEQDAPVSFKQDTLGNFSGITTTGKTFFQRQVISDISVHLQHFSIDEAHFYIYGEGTFLAETDTVALSIYLSRVGWVG